ncbi:hypothetical protein [Neptunicoccus cionae]|nr:hypothetical protein [Amylibacter cionae]
MDIFSKIGLTALIATSLLVTHAKASPDTSNALAFPVLYAGNSQTDITS